MSIIFYSGTKNASSWALRAWLALKEADIAFEERVVDIRQPQRFANLKQIAEFSPPGAVPVLVVGEAVIFDSLAIMEYANDLGGGELLPRDLKERACARSLVAWQHSGLSGLCHRLSFESSFYSDRRAMTQEEMSQSERIFRVCESQLKNSGGPYLFGSLSLVDLAFVPTAIRLIAHAATLDPWPLTKKWTEEVLRRDSVQEWLHDAYSLPVVRLSDYFP